MSLGTVKRVRRELGLRCVQQKKRFRVQTTDSGHRLPVAPNLLGQDFTAARPDEVWTADITYVAAIKAYMTKMMTINEAMEIGETPEGLSVNELKEIMKDIQQRIKTLMGKKMLEVTDADTDMRHIVRGLIQKEGYAAPPGVIFRCSGFEIGSANLYDGHQKALMTALQSSSEAKTELSAALGCTGGK